MSTAALSSESTIDRAADSGYGRARLCVGIAAVGTWVLVATAGVMLDGPRWFAEAWAGRAAGGAGHGPRAEAVALLMAVLAYVAVQLPFDLLGGYLLPRGYGRAVPSPGRFLRKLIRGVTVHGALLFAVAATLTVAGHYGGLPALWFAAVGGSLVLLAARSGLARALASIGPARAPLIQSNPKLATAELPTRLVDVTDEGFTGGVLGVVRPGVSVLPAAWEPVLGEAGLRLACARRAAAVATGAWRRGRWLALGFTWVGFAVAAACVGLFGSATVGTAAGTIAFSLWFTLWSFLGLLVLPTFSRRGVAEVDAQLLTQGVTPDELHAVTQALDQRQDGEPERAGWVESIFHPIPSVNNREAAAADPPPRGAWDAARTTVFVSAAGLGLLGRAVHCNCGRPDLWAFLPTE